MASKAFYAIVAGVGSGLGRAAALRFSKTYPVVLFARKPENYTDVVDEIRAAGGQAFGVQADVADAASLDSAFETIKTDLLPGASLAAAIFNANGGFVRKPFLELTAQDFDGSVGVAARGFFLFALKALPLLLDAVPGAPYPPTLVATGATASVRGSANFATMAAGKFAQRAITQSLAREFGPKGVHVALAIIDGGIDTPWGANMIFNNGVEDGKIKPEAIAESYWNLHTQHRSAFTQELDIRPYVEKF